MKSLNWNQFKNKIVALTTTRQIGASKKPFDKFNLAYHVGDDPHDVLLNRQTLLKKLKVLENQIIFTHQSHSLLIKKVSKEDGGRGYTSFEDGIEGDGLYTYDSRLALAIFHADCVPVFLFNPSIGLVAILHAGKKGTLNYASSIMFKKILDNEGAKAEDFYAHLGPSLHFSNLLISETEKDEILTHDPRLHVGIKKINQKYYLDVPFLNFYQLRELGIPQENITISTSDTFEEDDKFYSTLKTPVTGRHVSIIMKK